MSGGCKVRKRDSSLSTNELSTLLSKVLTKTFWEILVIFKKTYLAVVIKSIIRNPFYASSRYRSLG